jgi:hypothetical protein
MLPTKKIHSVSHLHDVPLYNISTAPVGLRPPSPRSEAIVVDPFPALKRRELPDAEGSSLVMGRQDEWYRIGIETHKRLAFLFDQLLVKYKK